MTLNEAIEHLDETLGDSSRTCFSDLTEQERGKVMAGKGVPWLISLAEHLADSLHAFGDAFDVTGRE